jgi:hypothetical protein
MGLKMTKPDIAGCRTGLDGGCDPVADQDRDQVQKWRKRLASVTSL